MFKQRKQSPANSALKDLLSGAMTKNLIFLKLKQNGKIRYFV